MRALILLLALAGCAVDPRYSWEHDPTRTKCEKMVWVQMESISGFCSRDGVLSDALACSYGCVAASIYPEEEAKDIYVMGESLYDHEAKHVLLQMRHPK